MNIFKSEGKQKIIDECILYFAYVIFFTLFFCTFTFYKSLILREEYLYDYVNYGYNFVEALILSKIILLGQHFQLGERFSEKALIISAFYKTVVFSLFVLAFMLIEHFLLGFIHGKGFSFLLKELLDKGVYEILARLLIMFFVFILFFAFLELGRAIGKEKFFDLFFRRHSMK